jgi:hypothetical protein
MRAPWPGPETGRGWVWPPQPHPPGASPSGPRRDPDPVSWTVACQALPGHTTGGAAGQRTGTLVPSGGLDDGGHPEPVSTGDEISEHSPAALRGDSARSQPPDERKAPVNVTVIGATGRTGRHLLDLAARAPGHRFHPQP